MASLDDRAAPTVRPPLLIAFAAVAVVHLLLLGLDVDVWDTVTKCLLAPILAAWALQHDAPRLLVAALGCCLAGDFFMDFPDLFVAGMAAFAVAHVCLIRLFVQRGAVGRLRAQPWAALAYLAAAVGLVAWCWSGFDADVRPFVPAYALLLAGTAATALAVDVRAGVGALLFLLSDGLIAASEAGRVASGTATSLAIMVLYISAIALLTIGTVLKERRSRALGAPFDPTQRTDCWPRLPERAGS